MAAALRSKRSRDTDTTADQSSRSDKPQSTAGSVALDRHAAADDPAELERQDEPIDESARTVAVEATVKIAEHRITDVNVKGADDRDDELEDLRDSKWSRAQRVASDAMTTATDDPFSERPFIQLDQESVLVLYHAVRRELACR